MAVVMGTVRPAAGKAAGGTGEKTLNVGLARVSKIDEGCGFPPLP
jgi:hypothetical protein